LIAPWHNMEKDQTEIYLCHDKKNLYFLFKVKDTKLVYGT
jgi:chondroitin AC lyase